jgi:Secretion system C-terminal sorting domain
MNLLVKTIIVLSLLLPVKAVAQCPIAGNDSSATYCRNEPFDLSALLSADADSGGVFLNPSGDTLVPPQDTLPIPGIYTYVYIVSDSGCVNDTAELIVTIDPCIIGGVDDLFDESHLLAYPNPATDQLHLFAATADNLLIYNAQGQCVFRQTAPLTSAIDISQLEPGLYLLMLQQDGAGQFQRFLKVDAP